MARRRTTRKQSIRRIRAEPDPRLSRSLEYGLTILECFTRERPTLGVAEIAEEIGIGRSTAHRYALTLVMLGYLEQDHKRKYRLAAHAHEPGMAAIGGVRRAIPAGRVLEELRDWTGHTVSMAVLHDTSALYVHRLAAHGAGQHDADGQLGVGTSVPLHTSAVGKALLAFLPDEKQAALIAKLTLDGSGPNSVGAKRELVRQLRLVRDTGLAFSDEERSAGRRAVGAPIRVATLAPAAIEVTAPADSRTLTALREDVGPLLLRAAEQIAQAIVAEGSGP
jgi:DNA-binding IclR family transcriptional regulator